jgi:hypothetical protein
MRLRGGIAERCAQLARVGRDDRVRVQARVLAAGNVPDPAAVILAPDPELREIPAQGGKLVMSRWRGFAVAGPGCITVTPRARRNGYRELTVRRA